MTPHEIVEALVRHAPALIRRQTTKWGADPRGSTWCTSMTRIAYDVLRRLDVASEPIATIASAWNHRYAVWQQSGVDHQDAYMHTNDEFVLRGLGYTDPIVIHLVVAVPAVSVIIDLACWQLARPSRGILLPSAIALPWDGEQAKYETPAGSLEYRRWPRRVDRVKNLEAEYDWTVAAHNFGPVSKVIARRIASQRPIIGSRVCNNKPNTERKKGERNADH